MFIEDINKEIIYNTQCKLNVINIFLINKMTHNLKDIKVKLSSYYLYDHKIKLTSDVISSCCRAY